MNTYSAEFSSWCPINGALVLYRIRIETTETIQVEQILAAIRREPESLHEDIADRMFATFGGRQTLSAHHHGVTIETTRPMQREIEPTRGMVRNGYF